MCLFGNLFGKRFIVTDRKGIRHFMSAKRLYNRVMKDKQSDFNWIASATELVHVCNQPGFPKEYAQAIEIAILNCFANLESYQFHKITDADQVAVSFCYKALANIPGKANRVRHKYLEAFITGIARDYLKYPEFEYYGKAYRKIRDEWIKKKFQELCDASSLDFRKLRHTLSDEYDQMIKTAESEGAFEEDLKEHLAAINSMLSSFDLFAD